jgi:hypothetical protein
MAETIPHAAAAAATTTMDRHQDDEMEDVLD